MDAQEANRLITYTPLSWVYVKKNVELCYRYVLVLLTSSPYGKCSKIYKYVRSYIVTKYITIDYSIKLSLPDF